MAIKMVKTVLFSSLLASTTHAFMPIDIPSELESNGWSALTTLEPITPSPSPSTPLATATPTPDFQVLPFLDPNIIPDLKRQVTGQGTGVALTAIGQISPITTYYANSMVDGTGVQVPVVYTQTFVPVPDQWPSPTAGAIGLGTIQGTVGVVKSKRSLPTQVALVDSGDMTQRIETQSEKELSRATEPVGEVDKKVEDEVHILADEQDPEMSDEELNKALGCGMGCVELHVSKDGKTVTADCKCSSTSAAGRALGVRGWTMAAVGIVTACLNFL
ncbi:hypothetical protein LTR99_004614 [Exophiala xenobiotica]|uniref:Uncharacterized protein n=1 Tax=Vermiconidia calcicola TaxID=1690605 RepID=A0AAV9QD32_9PEZI|nr:hypothetical protein LTR72_004466 [Exophiala xenobiotica]KAK5539895.1 hypothetical protein LTR25_003600 [Vermiconidia calcicola]KAK5546986.1 hypothetical protein LTR23_002989 [Chaetothyriales sp. CCFEE 6169]KAK5274677.1 hypothetical protein LTR96_001278 [Exophiala xenobiotica]KAK5293768.1 hypothetical protein LTR14_004659 [Exophiala xenobiotica]